MTGTQLVSRNDKRPNQRILFVTWDGPSTTYFEALFFPVLIRCVAELGAELHVLQFSWEAQTRQERLLKLADKEGFSYHCINWARHGGPLSRPVRLIRGILEVRRLVRQHTITTVIARSILPGAMTALLRRVFKYPFSFLYDSDGFPADERVEFGAWKRHQVSTRVFGKLDGLALREADAVIVKTKGAAEVAASRSSRDLGSIHVVPNGRDPEAFNPRGEHARRATKQELEIPVGSTVVGYVGSYGKKYSPDLMARTYRALLDRNSSTFAVILSSASNHAALRAMFPQNQQRRVRVLEVEPPLVPAYVRTFDVGLALIADSPSTRSVFPIKLGEYLLSGVPVIHVFEPQIARPGWSSEVSFRLDSETESLCELARWVERVQRQREQFRTRARAVGLQYCSLDSSWRTYTEALLSLDDSR